MPTHEFAIQYASYGIDPSRGEEFCDLLHEELADRQPAVMWQRVSDCRDGSLWVALAVDGSPEDAGGILANAMTKARFALEAIEYPLPVCVQRDRREWRHADPHTCPPGARR